MDIKKLIEQKKEHLKKYTRHNNFEVYLDGKFIKAFPDRFQRDRFINTKKFEKLCENKKIEYCDIKK